MTDELVEKVAAAAAEAYGCEFEHLSDGPKNHARNIARAVIPLVIEEAAKVAENRALYFEYVKRSTEGEWEAGSPYDRGAVKASNEIAASIRNLGSRQ